MDAQKLFRALALAATATTLSSCTQYSLVPPSEYDKLDEKTWHGYRIETADEHIFVVKRLTVTDSMLIVHELRNVPKEPIPDLPFTVDLEEVRRIETIGVDFVVPIVIGGGIIAALIAFSQTSWGAD